MVGNFKNRKTTENRLKVIAEGDFLVQYDIIIIGAGPAGLTAAIYAGRAEMKTLLISNALPGGQAMLTEEIENYPGFPSSINGPKLITDMYEQAKKLAVEFKRIHVNGIEKKDKTFTVRTKEGMFQSLSLIIATGASYRKLGIKGESEFTGRGVSYCGVCDAPLFKNKAVAVVGGGDAAVYEAGHLLKFACTLHLIHRRDRLRAAKIMQKRVLDDKKTVMHWNSTLEEIYGSKFVEGIKIKDLKTGKISNVPLKGVFIFVGIEANSKAMKDIVKIDEKGYILTDENMKTSLEGMYACGDVRKKILRQISTAVGEGATAAFSAEQYAEELKGTAYK